MRIWYINHYASTPDQLMTGAYYLMQALAVSGNDVTLFASGFNYYRRREIRLQGKWFAHSEMHDAVKFLWIRATPTSGRAFSRLLNMLTFSFVTLCCGISGPRPDVVIGSCPHPFAGFVAWLLARRHGAKFVYEVRDIWPESLTEGGIISSRHVLVKLLAAMQRFLYRRAALIVSVLPKFDHYLKQHSIPFRAFLWVPNGVPVHAGRKPQPIAEKNVSPAEPFIFMYLGGHSKYQKLDTLLDAARLLQEKGVAHVRLVFVGDGSEKPRLIERAREMNLSNVAFEDAVPRSEVHIVAARADAFILHFQAISLLKYGMSNNKLCDYMMAARPIIFAADAVNDAVCESASGITIPPESPEALADAMFALASTPLAERKAMGERARSYAHTHFDVTAQAERLNEALRNLT